MGQIGIGVLGVKHGLDICFSVGGIVRGKKVIIFLSGAGPATVALFLNM